MIKNFHLKTTSWTVFFFFILDQDLAQNSCESLDKLPPHSYGQVPNAHADPRLH